MRLGIYGGTFDPVHYGHLIAADQFREQCELDQVLFVPAGKPPHKQTREITAGKQRVEMLKLAVAGDPRFGVSTIELDRDEPSFTLDTLGQLRREQPDAELYFLMGADSLAEFPTWREPARIVELAHIAVANRGRSVPDPGPVGEAIGVDLASRVTVVEMPAVDLSASDLRARVGSGRSIRYMTPRAVEEYVRTHDLYGC
ncbi:MAG: nicotinate-nucleotide adenylyltransferase [Maioricimonas sp. JB045]|uniref:nicotinate-nucleotide adenylyltransferase n=1 Tax=Maioricimonas sp. JC845 TaxID=3232138 RepID=UPI00345AB156